MTADLLLANGWENVTTRDITAAAGIANGTLFNYFSSKEAIAVSIIGEALEAAEQDFDRRRTGDESLDEDLFGFEWSALKRLRKCRKFLAPAVASIFSPLAQPLREDPGAEIRARHLRAVQRVLAGHGAPQPLPAVLLQLYWTLHIGAFAFWANDSSPHQEDTLALLDRSLKLFAASLSGSQGVEHERSSE
ncbi:MAG TPA: TetR/AcrR family transcriptional regulator [Bryobacteraceae bacterium]